jgi:hypothetical protein
MKTFLVTIDETESSISPEIALMSIKGVKSVDSQTSSPISLEEWLRPGRSATDEELEDRLNSALQSGEPKSIKEAFRNSKYM